MITQIKNWLKLRLRKYVRFKHSYIRVALLLKSNYHNYRNISNIKYLNFMQF